MVAIGIVVAIVVGIYTFATARSTPIHPDVQTVPSVQQATPLPKWAAAVTRGQQIARSTLIEQNLPGLSVAIGVDGTIVWAEGFGWADIAKRLPVAPNTRFRVGHASKSITSVAVGLLLDQDRLDLREEIQTYVPQFPKKQWPVTLRDLMGHLAGIRHYENDHDSMPTAQCDRASEGLGHFANDPLRFEPETKYAYSTFGWVLVSAAVEAVAGEPFFTFMRTNVFDPLGMSETMPDSANTSIPNLTTFYDEGSFRLELAKTVDYSCFAGAGGFTSTPSDLVRFGLALSGGKFLKAETVRRLQSPQYLLSGSATEYGLGWMVGTDALGGEPERWVGHSSRTPLGASTTFMIFRDREIVVAVMANLTNKDARSIAARIADVFSEQPRRPPGK